MAPALYDLDAKTQKLLRVETFSGDFILKDFFDGLSANSIITSRKSGGAAFDPKPYIRTYEVALDKLKGLNQELLLDEESLNNAAQATERQHNTKMDRLNRNFEDALQIFESVDTKISTVGRTAVSIGQRLEVVEKQRQRAQEAALLVNCYSEFLNTNASATLERIRLEGVEGKVRCAAQTRRLVDIARKFNTPDIARVRASIEKYEETFEKDLLKDFDVAYRRGDFNAMRIAATVLDEFNGGSSAIQVFVNQHDFFIVHENLKDQDLLSQDEIWQNLADPDCEDSTLEPQFAKLIDGIRSTCAQESKLIAKVFPKPQAVLQVFLRRVFAQSIQLRLESLLSFAESRSTLAYLRTLHLAHTSLVNLVEKLKVTCAETAGISDSGLGISVLLDLALEDLFVPYVEGRRYMDSEMKSLQELYASFLYRFHSFHSERRRTKPTKMFDKYYTQLQAATSSDSSSESRMGQLRRLAGIERTNSKDRRLTPKFNREDGLVSTESAKRMLGWMAEAIGRALELSGPSETAKDANNLLNILIEFLCKTYIETALDFCLDESAQQDSKSEVDFGFLTSLRPITSVMFLVFASVETALMPLSMSSLTARRDMTTVSSREQSWLEEKTNKVLQNTLDLVLAHVNTILSRQKRNDFRPKDDDIGVSLQTAPAVATAAFLKRVNEAARRALDGTNLEHFLIQVGGGVRDLLLDHFRKFFVNAAGALMLAQYVFALHVS